MAEELSDIQLTIQQAVAQYMDQHVYNNGDFQKHTRTAADDSRGGSTIVISSRKWGIKNCVVAERIIADDNRASEAVAFPFQVQCLKKYATSPYDVMHGWFVSRDYPADAYMLVWPQLKEAEDGESVEVSAVRYLIVGKRELKAAMSKAGYLDTELLKAADVVRRNKVRKVELDPYVQDYDRERFYMLFDMEAANRPVELVITRSFLEQIAGQKSELK